MHDEAILAFALRFLKSNLDDEEVAEALLGSLYIIERLHKKIIELNKTLEGK